MEYSGFKEQRLRNFGRTYKWALLVSMVLFLLLTVWLAATYKTFTFRLEVMMTGGEYSSERTLYRTSAEGVLKSANEYTETTKMADMVVVKWRASSPALSKSDTDITDDKDRTILEAALKERLSGEGMGSTFIVVRKVDISTSDWASILKDKQVSFDMTILEIAPDTTYDGVFTGYLKYKEYTPSAINGIKEEALSKIADIVSDIVKKDLKSNEDLP